MMKIHAKKILAPCLALSLLLSLTACTQKNPPAPPTPAPPVEDEVYDPTKDPEAGEFVSEIFIAMNTPIDLKTYGTDREEALQAAKEKIFELENLISKTVEGSDVWKLNHAEGKPVKLHPMTMELLTLNEEYYGLLGGAYDITVEPLVELWGIGQEGTVAPPTDKDIQKLLPLVGNEKLILEGDTARLEGGATIDLGAIAKGYASDVLFEVFQNYKISGALFSLGGNVGAYGRKVDGSVFNIGVRDPAGDAVDFVATLGLTNAFMVSSGNYERFFEYEGKRYHHIMDPAVGRPSESDIVAVTIISANGAYADALSTALFVKGYEKSMEYYAERQDFEAVFITKDNQMRVTDGLTDVITFTGNGVLTYGEQK